MSAPAIEFEGLSKTFTTGFLGKKQHALKSLSLQIPTGTIYGFLGANGAGKTTSIKMLMGLHFPSRGSVKIFGQAPGTLAVQERIGYLPERPYFHDTMGVDSFLNFHRRLFGKSKRGFLSNQELKELVGLADVGSKPLRSYSKGMLQRAGIAQALVNNPDLVILDEPMSGLDPVGRREMRDLITKLHSMGKTIFFSSHILSDVEQICERIAFLENGELRHEGSLRELLGEETAPFEVVLRGMCAAALSPRRLNRQNGEDFYFRCENEKDTQSLVQAAWASGATLVSCGREQKSLEEVLFGRVPLGKERA